MINSKKVLIISLNKKVNHELKKSIDQNKSFYSMELLFMNN
jgi:hypothetical protein